MCNRYVRSFSVRGYGGVGDVTDPAVGLRVHGSTLVADPRSCGLSVETLAGMVDAQGVISLWVLELYFMCD